MLSFYPPDYQKLLYMNSIPDVIKIEDHLNGFDHNLHNPFLEHLNSIAVNQPSVIIGHIATDKIKNRYPNLDFYLSDLYSEQVFPMFKDYNNPPDINYKNFICSFNGSEHISRRLLTAILKKFKWFNTEYCTKNFVFSLDSLDGQIEEYVGEQINFYRKFFISDNSEMFFQSTNSFGHVRFDHNKNIYNLQQKLTESFIHVVSETLATSHWPMITEKFLYSVVTKGLFVTYGPPGWHNFTEQYLGFKQYNKLFDYKFDQIDNPIDRLIELTSMLSKFSVLDTDEWKDLYQIEQDTVEYNYNHYYSGRYLENLKKYEFL